MKTTLRSTMRWFAVVCFVLLLRGTSLPAAEEAVETQGKVDEVTVYRGQALVTRMIEVPGAAGLREVVVTDLPEQIVPGSLYAESADGVEVRSVRYRIRPVMHDVREEVRTLDEKIRAVQDQIRDVERKMKVVEENKQYLGKLEQFTAPAASTELTKGVLNAETIKSLTEFQFQQRSEIADQEQMLGLQQRDLSEKLSLLSRERDVLTGGSSKTIREAVVFVNLKNANGKLRVCYLVNGASWSPSYNVRTDAKRGQVMVEYNAAIQQMSGEDWGDVRMTLSTATPSLVAKAPVLEPLMVVLGNTPVAGKAAAAAPNFGAYLVQKEELERQKRSVEVFRGANSVQSSSQQAQDSGNVAFNLNEPSSGNPAAMNGVSGLDARLNDLAFQCQVLDLVAEGKVDNTKNRGKSPIVQEEVSVSYELPGRTSLPSRSDRQLIQVAALPMKGDFYRVGIPVLTSYVYEEASVVNDSKMVLLAGPVATYLAGQFVGHGNIPTVAIGESFTVGFGIDSSLRVSRELLKKSDSVQGGNRVVDFTYQLTVENFGTEKVNLRLIDRIPMAKEKENEVKVTLVSSGEKLSGDEAYQQTERKKGLLRWDVTVPGQAIGPKALAIDYQLSVEYDKQLSIASLPTQP